MHIQAYLDFVKLCPCNIVKHKQLSLNNQTLTVYLKQAIVLCSTGQSRWQQYYVRAT